MNLRCFFGFHRLSQRLVEFKHGFYGFPCTRCSYVKLLKPPSVFAAINEVEVKESQPKEESKEEPKVQTLPKPELPPPPVKKDSKKLMIKVGAIGHKTVHHTVTFSNKPPELQAFTVRFRVKEVRGKSIVTSIVSISGTKEPQHRQVVVNNWLEVMEDLRGIQWE